MSETKSNPTLQIPVNVDLPADTDEERAPSPVEKQKRGKKASTPQLETLDLNIILKFIKPYDGSRETLNSFIINCNNAYELASNQQKPILFKYILCQLQGKAEVACSIKEFQTWEQLKEFLKTQFSDRKHSSHLLMELQESKQLPTENVSQFALRIETLLSQLLTEISLSNCKIKELPGRTAAMEELALHHFLMGLHPRISNIVRCKSPRSLNEATNFAISEERIQQTLYKRSIPEARRDNRPTRMNNPTRPFQPQRPFSTVPHNHNPNSAPNFPTGSNTITCRYCKAPGHSIEQCRKREYNNRFRSSQQPSGSVPFRRVNFNETEPQGYDEVDDHYDQSQGLN